MIKAANGNRITEFIFDSLGNLLTDNQNGRVVKSEYNALGFRKTLSYPSGRKLKIIPDDLNRIQRIENNALGNEYPGEAGAGAVLLNDSFVGPSRLFERQFGNGAKANLNYDGARRTTSIKYSKNGTHLFEIQSLYDAVGNKRFENILKDSNNKGEFYTYDSLYRLIKARQGLDIPSFNVNDFKPANSKTGISPDKSPTQVQIDNFINALVLPNGNKTAFAYDSLGNRLTKKETGKPNISYQTNNLNEYTSIDGATPTYDKNGNMTSDDALKYFYDYKNRLVKVEDANGNPVAKYDYDATGRRIEKTANGKKTILIYDGDDVIEERNDQDKVIAQYVFGDEVDEIVQMAREMAGDKKDYYYLRNSLGNVIALSGNAEDIIEEYSYSPFGIVNSVSGVENPYLFTSRRIDPETMLMYYRARYYSPELGRFLQRDPIGYEDSMNLFEYVDNNPLVWIDPSGQQESSTGDLRPRRPGIGRVERIKFWDVESVVVHRVLDRPIRSVKELQARVRWLNRRGLLKRPESAIEPRGGLLPFYKTYAEIAMTVAPSGPAVSTGVRASVAFITKVRRFVVGGIRRALAKRRREINRMIRLQKRSAAIRQSIEEQVAQATKNLVAPSELIKGSGPPVRIGERVYYPGSSKGIIPGKSP